MSLHVQCNIKQLVTRFNGGGGSITVEKTQTLSATSSGKV